MRKIAFVTDAAYPFNKGGKETRIYEITKRLAEDGNDVTIYCMQWWEGGKTTVHEGVKFYAISPYYPLYAGGRRSTTQAVLFALHCFKLITKEFDIIEVDCVPHFQLFTAKIVCLLKGKKMFTSWHEVWGKSYWMDYLGPMGFFAWLVERMSSMMPDVIISVSDHTTVALRETLHVKQRIVTIPNGVDVQSISKNKPAEYASDIVFAGRLLTHKNVDVLLRAVAILKERRSHAKLLVVGDGPERKNLERLAGKLGLGGSVAFLGFLEDHNDLYSLMQASRLFAFPSTREGFGIAVIEANACGLPVVTVDHEQNAAKELIEEGKNGVVCALDPSDLANTMEALLKARGHSDVYVEHAKRYNWDTLMPKVEALYALHAT